MRKIIFFLFAVLIGQFVMADNNIDLDEDYIAEFDEDELTFRIPAESFIDEDGAKFIQNELLEVTEEGYEPKHTYEEDMFFPVSDVVIYGGNIYYYLWLGVGTNDFSLNYSSDNPAENAYDLWYDIHERHYWNDSKCKAERAGFYNNLNSGLYAPDLGWDF